MHRVTPTRKMERELSCSLDPVALRSTLQQKIAEEERRREMAQTKWWTTFTSRAGTTSASSNSANALRSIGRVIKNMSERLGISSQQKIVLSTKFIRVAQSCDLILMNAGQTFEGRIVPLPLVRGVVSTGDQHFLPKLTYVDPWNDVGIVVELNGQKHVLMVDSSGLVLKPLEDVVSLCIYKNITCALRKVIFHSSTARELAVERLVDLASAVVGSYIPWSLLKPTVPLSPKQKKVIRSSDAPALSSSVSDEVLFVLLKYLLDRAKLILAQPTADEISEILRIFFMLDEDKTGSVPVEKIHRLFEKVPNEPDRDHEEETQSRAGRSIRSMGSSEVIKAMDRKKDGLVRLDDFVDCYIRSARGDFSSHQNLDLVDQSEQAPGPSFSGEQSKSNSFGNASVTGNAGVLDVAGVVKGEFIGVVLCYLGIMSISSNDSQLIPNTDIIKVMENMCGDYCCPSTFSTQGPPPGHQGVPLASMVHNVAASSLQVEDISHFRLFRSNNAGDKSMALRSLILPLHLQRFNIETHLLNQNSRGSLIFLSENVSFNDEIFLSRRTE